MSNHDFDSACIEGMRAGNTRALDDLYGRYGDLLYSLVLRIVRGPAEAEEVCQEAWLQAWRRVASYNPARGSVGAWLVTLARSRAIDRLRSEGSRARAEGAAVADPPDPAPDASIDAGHRQMNERVRGAMAQLEPRQRQVLELAYFSGLTQTEIAERIDAPLGTVKSWTRQGLLRLRELVPQEASS